MNGIDAFLIQYGLAAIFFIMLIKTIGVPIPIPGDLIIFTAATRVAQGKLVGWQVFFAILIALLLGGWLQFLLARGAGLGLLSRFGRYIGLTKPRIDAASQKIRKGGVPGLAISILIPGVRGAAIVAAGLVDLAVSRIPDRSDTWQPPFPQPPFSHRLPGRNGPPAHRERAALARRFPPRNRAAGPRLYLLGDCRSPTKSGPRRAEGSTNRARQRRRPRSLARGHMPRLPGAVYCQSTTCVPSGWIKPIKFVL